MTIKPVGLAELKYDFKTGKATICSYEITDYYDWREIALCLDEQSDLCWGE